MALNKNKIVAAAQKYQQKGQLDKAIKELQRLVDEDPKDVRTLLKIGDLHTKKGDREQATAAYKRVAEFYSSQGFFLKAVAVYKQILRVDQSMVEINVKLAELYHQLGLVSDAMNQFQTVVSHYERSGQITESMMVLKKMVELDPDVVASRIKLAELCASQGMTAEAVREFEQAAKDLKNQQRHDDYLKVTERLVYFDPQRMDLLKELAEIYLQRGDSKRALAKLQLCFKMNPRDPITLGLLAQAFISIDQSPKAISVYKELANIYHEQGDQVLQDEVWQKIAQIAPNDPDYLARQQALAPPVQAVVAPSKAPPADPPALVQQAPVAASPAQDPAGDKIEECQKLLTETDVYVKYGLKDRALEHVKKIFLVDPDFAPAYDKQRSVALSMGDRNLAAHAIEQLVRIALAKEDQQEAARLVDELEGFLPGYAGLSNLRQALVGGVLHIAENAEDDFDDAFDDVSVEISVAEVSLDDEDDMAAAGADDAPPNDLDLSAADLDEINSGNEFIAEAQSLMNEAANSAAVVPEPENEDFFPEHENNQPNQDSLLSTLEDEGDDFEEVLPTSMMTDSVSPLSVSHEANLLDDDDAAAADFMLNTGDIDSSQLDAANASQVVDSLIFNDDAELLNDDAELLNDDAELLNDDAELLDDGVQLLDDDVELLDDDVELLDDDAELLDDDAELLDDDAELLNDDAGLLNDDAELLNDDVELLDDDAELLDDDAELLGDDAELLDDDAELLGDDAELLGDDDAAVLTNNDNELILPGHDDEQALADGHAEQALEDWENNELASDEILIPGASPEHEQYKQIDESDGSDNVPSQLGAEQVTASAEFAMPRTVEADDDEMLAATAQFLSPSGEIDEDAAESASSGETFAPPVDPEERLRLAIEQAHARQESGEPSFMAEGEGSTEIVGLSADEHADIRAGANKASASEASEPASDNGDASFALSPPKEEKAQTEAHDPAEDFFPDELEEAEFFVRQGLLDEAIDILNSILEDVPDSFRAKDLLAQIARIQAGEDEEEEESSTDADNADADNSNSDDQSFNLAAELLDDLEELELPEPEGTEELQYSVDEVFSEFKRGVEKTVSSDDADTHYDLGIAYREMGLAKDSIHEFELATQNPDKKADALYMIGICQQELGRPKDAVTSFRHALKMDQVRPNQKLALLFELGTAYQQLDKNAKALNYLSKVFKKNPKFKDVAKRVKALQSLQDKSAATVKKGKNISYL